MARKTGRPIKQVAIGDRKIKVDFKKLFGALAKGAIMAFVPSPAGIGKEAVNFLQPFSLKEDASHLAFRLVNTALINAAHDLISENKFKLDQKFQEVEILYDDEEYASFLDQISEQLGKKTYLLTWENLKQPTTFELLDDFILFYKQWLVILGMNQPDSEIIGRRFIPYFTYAFHDEWRRNHRSYQNLVTDLDSPMAEAEEKAVAWEQYFSYLVRQANEPVFDASFGLSDIYVELNAYYEKAGNQGKSKIESGARIDKKRMPLKVEEELDHWIGVAEKNRAIKVISGGPGSGKSTLAKIWTGKLAQEH